MRFNHSHLCFFLLVNLFLWGGSQVYGQCNSPVVFNSPGDNTFFVPAGVNSLVVEVWGAGAGGAGRTINGTGGGGGGGAYSRSELIVTPGSVYTVFVGQGGGSSTNGQDSWIALSENEANKVVLAKGGLSPGINSQLSGLGGSSANGVGTFRFNGGDGAAAAANAGGGGGSSAGIGIDGNPGIEQNGGTAPVGGGAGGDGATSDNQNGNSPILAPGGGGGGARGNNQSGGTGSNGRVRITYTCQFFVGGTLLDDGAISGTTIIEYGSRGLNYWTAPKGLTEFEVFVVGGGGGGGFGNAAGGGGAGGVTMTSFTNINGGQGFLEETVFTMNVGDGGPGSGAITTKGTNGTMSIFGYTNPIYQTIAGGGGGGASNNSVNGNNGFQLNASGGGASGLNTPGGGRENGNDGSAGFNSSFGGGGGGRGENSPGTSGNITDGPGANFTAFGGNGGDGFSSDFRGNIVIYAAGGGGTTNGGSNSSPQRNVGGRGGSDGTGGNANHEGFGLQGSSRGSGGGAGVSGGGAGNTGIVIIRYPNVRILPVEYLYFDANFKRETKSVDLKWATAKEWENSHFEIQRSLQGVKNWEVIGNEPGYGWSDTSVEYVYSDNNLPLIGGMAYYRLKQVDFSGNFDFSKTVSVRLPTLNQVKGVWRAFPNPNSGEIFNLELIDEKEYFGEDLRVRLISPFSSNKVIARNNLRQISGSILEELRKVSKGIYVLEISWGQKVEFIKIMKH
ncbi:T9SS type A sorting domain-containing protein [Aquiflexum sp.]|uniref:T9SS type A sorting domain-containing protein n=1 Tax=Aquiflexum sp. TaxID=1872584 RepID=UPI00359310FB